MSTPVTIQNKIHLLLEDKVVIEKIIDFIYPDERNMTDEEIEAELQRLKIDMRPAIETLKKALKEKRNET